MFTYYFDKCFIHFGGYFHRPALKRALDKLPGKTGPLHMQVAHQWSPEIPATQQLMNNHRKFIPTQFRTQPMNLPGGLVRQTTSVTIYDSAGTNSHPGM